MSPNSPIPPSPEEDASFQKMLTALLSRAVSGAAAEQIAVKADLSRIVPENGVMPDHWVAPDSQQYPHATPKRKDHVQNPDGIDHAWDANHTPITHGATWAHVIYIDTRLALGGWWNMTITSEWGRRLDLPKGLETKIPDIQTIQILSYLAFPAKNNALQLRKNSHIAEYVATVPSSFIDIWEVYQKSLYPDKNVWVSNTQLIRIHVLYMAITKSLAYMKTLQNSSGASLLPSILPFAILWVYGNLSLHELLMDPKYKDINALDFVKQTLSRIDIEDLHKDQRDFYDFIKEMIDRVSEVKIPPEETPRPRP